MYALSGPMVYTFSLVGVYLFPCFAKEMVYTIAVFPRRWYISEIFNFLSVPGGGGGREEASDRVAGGVSFIEDRRRWGVI